MIRPRGDPRIRLEAWECAILRRALVMFRDQDSWKQATGYCLNPCLDSLDKKLEREYSRRRHNTRGKA